MRGDQLARQKPLARTVESNPKAQVLKRKIEKTFPSITVNPLRAEFSLHTKESLDEASHIQYKNIPKMGNSY